MKSVLEDCVCLHTECFSHFLTSGSFYGGPAEATLHLEHCSPFFSQGRCRFYHLSHTNQVLLSLQNVAGGFKVTCPDFTGSAVLPFSFSCPLAGELTGNAIFCTHGKENSINYWGSLVFNAQTASSRAVCLQCLLHSILPAACAHTARTDER